MGQDFPHALLISNLNFCLLVGVYYCPTLTFDT